MQSKSKTTIRADSIQFNILYCHIDAGDTNPDPNTCSRSGWNPTQGVSIVVQDSSTEKDLLRFDCFPVDPHYHYDPTGTDTCIMIDKNTIDNPINWSIHQLRNHLPDMLDRSGFPDIAKSLNKNIVASTLKKVASTAKGLVESNRRTVQHDHGDPIIKAGNIGFGLEIRSQGGDGGPAIHLLGYLREGPIEIMTFDCFRLSPHYHYGPLFLNERMFIDRTVVKDAVQWTLDLLNSEKLPAMVTRSGYPAIAMSLDRELIAQKIPQVTSTLKHMMTQSGST